MQRAPVCCTVLWQVQTLRACFTCPLTMPTCSFSNGECTTSITEKGLFGSLARHSGQMWQDQTMEVGEKVVIVE